LAIDGDCQSGIGTFVRIRDIGNESDKGISAELREVDQRLRENRPVLSVPELDEIKVRALESAPRSATMRFGKTKGTLMKSRLAVVMVLALGIFMCGTGASFAASGSSGSGSAGSAQYPEENENSLCGENGSGSSGSAGSEAAGCEHPCEEAASGSEQAAQNGSGGNQNCAHPSQQVSSGGGGGSLPYTGFLAVPVLLIGVGLLGAGVAMRFRVRSTEQF
jgi:hypothetical protein